MSASLVVINGTVAGVILLLALLIARGVSRRVIHNATILFAGLTALVALNGRVAPVVLTQAIEVPPEALDAPATLVIVWVFVSCLLLLRDLAGLVALARRARSWRSVDYDGGRVSTAADGAPMTIGLLEPVIFIPQRTFEMRPEAVRTIVRHERDHQRWRDPMTHLFVRVLRIVLWPVLPMWAFEFILRRAAEEAADTAALRDGADALSYAGSLVAVASWRSTAAIGTSSVASGALERRIERMLRPRGTNLFACVVASIVLFTGAVVASSLPPVVPEEIGTMSVVRWSAAEVGGAPQRPAPKRTVAMRRGDPESLPSSSLPLLSLAPRIPVVESPPPALKTAPPIVTRIAPPPVRIRNVIRIVN